jgi:polyribonucleotide nucleotidyltransferase
VSKEHGHLVLGKGGAKITSLQTKTETRISVTGLSDPEATISVSGDRANVQKCLAAIQQLIGDHSHKEVVSLAGNLVKAIIGQGGATINNIRDTSGARVDIASDSKSVSMVGTKAQVAKAKAMVQKAIDDELGPPKVPSGQVQYAFDMGEATGRLIGASGANMARLTKENNVSIDIKNDSMVYVTGPQAGVDAVKKEMEDTYNRFQETQERARKQKEEQAKMAAAQNGGGDSLDVDLGSSEYSGWDVPEMESSWGTGVSTMNGSSNGDAWGAAPQSTGANAW